MITSFLLLNLREKAKTRSFFCDDNCLHSKGETKMPSNGFTCALADETPFLNSSCTPIALSRWKQMWNRKKNHFIFRHVYEVCNGMVRAQGFTLWAIQCVVMVWQSEQQNNKNTVDRSIDTRRKQSAENTQIKCIKPIFIVMGILFV